MVILGIMKPSLPIFKIILIFTLAGTVGILNSCGGFGDNGVCGDIFANWEAEKSLLFPIDTNAKNDLDTLQVNFMKSSFGLSIIHEMSTVSVGRPSPLNSRWPSAAYATPPCPIEDIEIDPITSINLLYLNPQTNSSILATRHFNVFDGLKDSTNLENFPIPPIWYLESFQVFLNNPASMPDTTQIVIQTTLTSGKILADTTRVLFFK
ncbi:MAG: hypothetical protein ACI8ZN_000857 [Bacteroidia bacterium]